MRILTLAIACLLPVTLYAQRPDDHAKPKPGVASAKSEQKKSQAKKDEKKGAQPAKSK